MAYDSEPRFRVLHALRIKGFAKVDVLADLSAVDPDEVEQHLADFQTEELALFREARALWQLTPKGREVHADELEAEAPPLRPLIEPHYPPFLELNDAFKELCGDWQLRDGSPNDHTDAAHDAAVIARLLDIDSQAQPVVGAIGVEVTRLAPYGPRLSLHRPAGGRGRSPDVHRRHVRLLPRRVDGAPRGPHPHARHRPGEGGLVLMARFGRVLTAMVTPFDADGGLDLDAARTVARWLESHGNDGLVVAGTTGEAPVLSRRGEAEPVGRRGRSCHHPGHRRHRHATTPPTRCT